ncbi:MAG: hypothetical protein JNJ57_15735, partial [Saprospiraceae bacterium]|nr:hypothetical protein [Saprospiraceae bacterium]
MPKKFDITHPLLTEPGSSQRKRADDLLNKTVVKIDDHDLIDRLHFVYRFSKQVNFREYIVDAENADYTVESDWQQFFERSTPFILAQIAYFDTGGLQSRFEKLLCDYEKQNSPENLGRLFEFCFGDAIMPLFTWYAAFQSEEKLLFETAGAPAENEPQELVFKQKLADIIQSTLSKDLIEFIHIYNKARTHACLGPINFFPFVNQQIWGIQPTDLFGITPSPDPAEWAKQLGKILSKFQQIIEQLRLLAPAFVKQALVPVQQVYRERHQPHLGLLFSFLELFEYVQNDLNRLTTEHLEFFFKRALRIKAKAAKADQAHLVFEMAKHLEQYLVTKDKAFKDGKDLAGKDVIFHLDDEIVLDKAKVESLRTLFLHFQDGKVGKYKRIPLPPAGPGNTVEYTCCPPDITDLPEFTFNSYIHGVHMAAVANSADGAGAEFPE